MRRSLILVVRLKENSMRSLLFRTFLVAFFLSGLAIVANTLFFTRTLTPTEETEFGTTRGFSGSENTNVIEGAKVLWLFVRDPSFAKNVLWPQFAMSFIFIWAAALIGSHPKIRAPRA